MIKIAQVFFPNKAFFHSNAFEATTMKRFFHDDAVAFYPRLQLDKNDNPLISVMKGSLF